MTKRVSLDEIVSKRRASAADDGKLFKAVILDEPVEKAGYNPDTRSQRFIMSTETTDLYGDIVRQDGIKTDNFERNPVALAYHRHNAPIGWWKDVTKVNGRPKRTEGTITLHAAGTTDAVDEIDRLLSVNAIKACSIGFMPLEAEWILDDQGRNTWGLDFKESSLLEGSICSVPANPDALAKAAGGDMRLAAEMFERFLDTYCEKTAGGIVVRKDFADAYMAMKAPKTVVEAPKADEPIVSSLRVELDLEEAERQAEGFIEKWSKRFGEMFKAPEPPVVEEKTEPVVDEVTEPEAPTVVAGSRQKAVVASARMKQSLRERGLLT